MTLRSILCVLLTMVLAPASVRAEDQNAATPAVLQVKGKVVLRVHAQGCQVYHCDADANGKLAWKLVMPAATFESADGVKGMHYKGPTWECADGSKVGARKLAESPSPRAGSVPWVLLQATTHEGTGVFSNVTYIQRINTAGGIAPPLDGAKAGDTKCVEYSADYVFYGAGATTQPTAG